MNLSVRRVCYGVGMSASLVGGLLFASSAGAVEAGHGVGEKVHAADRAGQSSVTRVTLPAPAGERGTRDVKQAYCKVTADTPHWSKGAKSVIYKTRVQCFGNIPKVQVKVTGSLKYYSGHYEQTAATSKQTRTMGTLGNTETFYTPVENGKKVKYSANFWGHSTAQIVAPHKGTSAKADSKQRYVKVP
ncbi:hypothetical protein ACFVYR_05550 [Streptomyces sp. NPDC058284]|uniref:hypothetical protein n=1 Tax=unclassified Streptomyces TaxID=2593676 RepID=UPI00365BAEA5